MKMPISEKRLREIAALEDGCIVSVGGLISTLREMEAHRSMRCKVYCSFKQEQNGGVYLHFSAVVDGSDENKRFFKWTPGGTFMLYAVNPDIAAKYEMGKEYYLDFTPAQ